MLEINWQKFLLFEKTNFLLKGGCTLQDMLDMGNETEPKPNGSQVRQQEFTKNN